MATPDDAPGGACGAVRGELPRRAFLRLFATALLLFLLRCMIPRSFPPRYRGPRPSQVIRVTSGPWTGVIEDLARVTNAEEQLAYLENGYLAEGRIRLRPSLLAVPSSTGGALTGAPVQGVGAVIAEDGEDINWVVSAGRLWLDGVEVILTGFPLNDAVESVYGVGYGNYLVLSDGVNRPVKVDLTTKAPSFLTYFNHPAFGPPVVYYDKLFFIRADKPIEFQWSEEGDPDNGYTGPRSSGGTFNNAWELRQASMGPLTLLVPSNAALLYFRRHGIGVIQGPASDSFVADGVRDSISEARGTLSPGAAMLLDNGTVWFVDEHGRPSVTSLSGGARDITGPKVNLLDVADEQGLARVRLRHLPALGLILVAHPAGVDTWPTQLLVFRDGTDGDFSFQGRWIMPLGREIHALGAWHGLDGDTVTIGDEQGQCWTIERSSLYQDIDWPPGGSPTFLDFMRLARTAPLAYSPNVVKRFDILTVQAALPPVTDPGVPSPDGTIRVSYITPLNASTPIDAAPTPNPSLIAGPSESAPMSLQLGIQAVGSSIQVTVSTTAAAEAYDLVAIGVAGVVDGEQPDTI